MIKTSSTMIRSKSLVCCPPRAKKVSKSNLRDKKAREISTYAEESCHGAVFSVSFFLGSWNAQVLAIHGAGIKPSNFVSRMKYEKSEPQ